MTFSTGLKSALAYAMGPNGTALETELETAVLVQAPGDITLANGHILVGNGSGVAADVALSGDATISNTGVLTNSATSASVPLSTSPTKGIGYATGAGGTVTQSTDKSTTVALAKMSGAITMNNAALNAGVIVSFTLTNAGIAATDVLVLNHISGGTVGSYGLNAQCAAGSATINVRNNTAGNLSEAVVIQFAVIKGVNA